MRRSSNTAHVMALVEYLGWAVMQPTVLAMTDDRPTTGTDNRLLYILTGFQGLKVLQGKAHLLVSNTSTEAVDHVLGQDQEPA